MTEQNRNEWSKRLQEALKHLLKTGRINNQEDLEDILGYRRESISRNLSGLATKKFVNHFAYYFSDIFNADYIINGNGKLLKEDNTTKETKQEISTDVTQITTMFLKQLEEKDDIIKLLKKIIEEKDEVIRELQMQSRQYNKKEA